MVELSNPVRYPGYPGEEQGYIGSLEVTVSDVGLQASVNVLSDHIGEELLLFLSDLAGHERGWLGYRVWENLNRTMKLTASYHPRGEVNLLMELRSSAEEGCWAIRSRVLKLDAHTLPSFIGRLQAFFESV
jgi:hypothetical protein